MAKVAKISKGASEQPVRRIKIPLVLKLATAMVVLVGLLLAAAAAVSLWQGYSEAERSALALQQEKAKTLAGRIDGLVSSLENQLAWTTEPDWRTAGVDRQQADFTRLLRQFPAITELFYIDSRGFEQLKVSRLAPDSVASMVAHANEPRFTETVKARTWIGPVYVRNGTEMAGTIGMAHADGGVTIAELDLALLTAPVKAAVADGGEAFVVDGTGRLVAHPDRNPATGENDLSALPQVAAALAAGGSGATIDATMQGDAAPAFAAWAQAPRLGWTAIVQTPEAEALAPFQMLLWQTLLLLGAGLLLAAIVGASLARRIAAPIKRLQASTELLGEGDLTQRVDVHRRDEIGGLADKFNIMANRLQQSQKGLVAKIDDSAVGFDVALQQQSITAEMVRTISRSGYELERVLDALIDSTVRLTEANVGAVWLRDGEAFRLASQLGHTGDWVEAARKAPFTKDTDVHAVAAAAAYTGQVVNVDDVSRDLRFMGEYGERPPNSDERAALAIPLKIGDRVEAVFSLSRADPIPFIDRQVAVAQDFADQALIAIRDVRLLETIEAGKRDIAESRDEQAATHTITRVIGQSTTDAQPVLDAIAENAARLCKARYCQIALLDGTLLKIKAHRGMSAEAAELIASPFAPMAGGPAEQAISSREAVLVADLEAEVADELTRLLGIRSLAAVPLVRGDAAIGVMTVADPEPNALPERRLSLLRSFAEQAVIALDNARLADDLAVRGTRLDETIAQLAERTAERDESRHRHGADVEAAALQHAAELDEARRLHAADVDAAGQKLQATEQQQADELQEARRLHADDVEASAQKFLAAQQQHAAELEEARSLHAADVEQARKSLEAAEQQHVAEMEEAKRLHADEVEQARQTLEATQQRHAAEMEEAKRLHADDMEQARRTLEATQQQHAAELEEARRLHADDVEQARQTLEATQQQHAAELEEARRLHAADVDDASRTLEATQQRHAAEMEEVRRHHAAETEQTVQQHDAEIGEARRLHAEALDEIRSAHAAELDQVRHLHAAELGEALRLHAVDRDDADRFRSATTRALGLLGNVEGGPQQVFDAVVTTATELCRADSAQLSLAENGALRLVASQGANSIDGAAAELAVAEARVTHIVDDPARAALVVPIMLDGKAAGALALARETDEAFNPREIELAGTLAAEAAVAVASARLAGRLEERSRSLDRAQRDFHDATAQQAASAEVLRSVNDATFDLTDVLSGVTGHAARLCAATTARLYLSDGDTLQLAAGAGVTDEQRAYEDAHRQLVDRNSLAGRAALDKAVVHVPDIAGDEATRDAARFGAAAAMLFVPMVHAGATVGVLALARAEPGPFGERQIQLAKSLADEAVIAIENVRLSEAVTARKADYQEALRQQSAIAGILSEISRPVFDLDGVLTTLTASAASFCDAGGAAIYLQKDGAYSVGAATGAMPSELVRPQPAGRESWIGRAAMDGTMIHVGDTDREAENAGIAGISGLAAILCVPLLRDATVTGVFALTRSAPKPFSEHQVALARIFADEAVIAIENALRSGEALARSREHDVVLRDLRAARARLSESDRLASLGQLTAAVGREIEERLGEVSDVSRRSTRLVDDIRMVLEAAVIDGRTRAEVEELGDALKEQLDKAVWHGERAGSAVRNTLLQSFDGPGEHRPVDINTVVDESLGLAYQGARAGQRDFRVTLEKALDPKAGAVDLYPQEITRALLNVISNGFDATAQRSATANGSGYEPVLAASTRNLGDAVEITIRDNGTGIAAEVRERMFDRFFTTKPAGQGTGLGLSLSHDIIVKQHAGTIEVESEPGSFTEFRIVLPRGGAALASRAGEEQPDAARSGTL
jgi:GAF domain-containing protein/HAMP domain-containing protein